MEKKNYLTLMNVIACVAVVFLHTNGCYWMFSTERYWKTANIIECLFYFAVPCFYMITGATLMDYRDKYTLKEFFRKRIKKTVIPFIFWSLIGIVYGIFVQQNINIHDLSFKYVYNNVMNSNSVAIYWFFPALFSLYLSVPLFAAVEKSARKEIFTYLVVAGFVVNFSAGLVRNIWFPEYTWNIWITVVSGNCIYLMLGYLLCNVELSCKQRLIIYICAVTGFLVHCVGTYVVSMEAGHVVSTFKGYESPQCIMQAVGIFTWCRYNCDKVMQNKVISKIINQIASCSFGIYLLQFYIYTSLVMIFDINIFSIIYRLGAPFVVVIISVIIIKIIRKIPVLKHTIP